MSEQKMEIPKELLLMTDKEQKIRDSLVSLQEEVIEKQTALLTALLTISWNSGLPKDINHINCPPENIIKTKDYFVVGKWSDVPEIKTFFFEEMEFMDSDLNTFRVRLWMDIPKFDSWKEKARKHKKV